MQGMVAAEDFQIVNNELLPKPCSYKPRFITAPGTQKLSTDQKEKNQASSASATCKTHRRSSRSPLPFCPHPPFQSTKERHWSNDSPPANAEENLSLNTTLRERVAALRAADGPARNTRAQKAKVNQPTDGIVALTQRYPTKPSQIDSLSYPTDQHQSMRMENLTTKAMTPSCLQNFLNLLNCRVSKKYQQ